MPEQLDTLLTDNASASEEINRMAGNVQEIAVSQASAHVDNPGGRFAFGSGVDHTATEQAQSNLPDAVSVSSGEPALAVPEDSSSGGGGFIPRVTREPAQFVSSPISQAGQTGHPLQLSDMHPLALSEAIPEAVQTVPDIADIPPSAQTDLADPQPADPLELPSNDEAVVDEQIGTPMLDIIEDSRVLDGALDRAGDLVEFTITVTNSGDITLYNIEVTDPRAVSPDNPTGLVGVIAELEPGASSDPLRFTYIATQDDIDSPAALLDASASATGFTLDGEAVSAATTAFVAVTQLPSLDVLDVASVVDGVLDSLGEAVTFSIRVTNTGNLTLFNVNVSDPRAQGGLVGTISVLAPGQTSEALTFTYLLTQADLDSPTHALSSSATATGTTLAGISVVDTALVSLPIVHLDQPPALQLSIDAAVGDGLLNQVGDEIQYVVHVTNTGVVALFNVEVSDSRSVSPTNPTGFLGVIAELAPGATQQFTATLLATQADIDSPSSIYEITASAVGYTAKLEPVSANSMAVLDVVQEPFLSAVTEAHVLDGHLDQPGEVVDYSINISNTGLVTVFDIIVTDPRLVTIDNPDGVVGVITDLAPGASHQFIVPIDVTQVDLDAPGGVLSTTAVATGSTTTGQPVSTNADVSIDVTARPELILDKQVIDLVRSNDQANPLESRPSLAEMFERGVEAGDLIVYRVSVSNQGNQTLSGVRVSDPLTQLDDLIPALAPGESKVYILNYVVTSADESSFGGGDGDIDNTAAALSDRTLLQESSVEVPLYHHVPSEPVLTEALPAFPVDSFPEEEPTEPVSLDQADVASELVAEASPAPPHDEVPESVLPQPTATPEDVEPMLDEPELTGVGDDQPGDSLDPVDSTAEELPEVDVAEDGSSHSSLSTQPEVPVAVAPVPDEQPSPSHDAAADPDPVEPIPAAAIADVAPADPEQLVAPTEHPVDPLEPVEESSSASQHSGSSDPLDPGSASAVINVELASQLPSSGEPPAQQLAVVDPVDDGSSHSSNFSPPEVSGAASTDDALIGSSGDSDLGSGPDDSTLSGGNSGHGGTTSDTPIPSDPPVSAPEPGRLIVGSSASDSFDSLQPYTLGQGSGVITGSGIADHLVGDPGGDAPFHGLTANVVFVLDVSSSMTTGLSGDSLSITRLAALQQSVSDVLHSLYDSSALNIRVHLDQFSTAASPLGTFTLIKDGMSQDSELAGALSVLSKIKPTGFTNYEAGLQSSLNWIRSTQSDSPFLQADVNKVLFISDGDPNRVLTANSVKLSSDSTVAMTADQSMQHVLGTYDAYGTVADDTVNEISSIELSGGASHFVIEAIGLDVAQATLDRLSAVEGPSGSSDLATSLHQLQSVMHDLLGLEAQALPLGSDRVDAADGPDLIFADILNTDDLAHDQGLLTPPGSGWSVFTQLESGLGRHPGPDGLPWSRETTMAYLADHAQELSRDSGRPAGHDVILAGAGDDYIYAQDGDDRILPGPGADVMVGGLGRDRFVFSLNDGSGVDAIRDFGNGADKIIFQNASSASFVSSSSGQFTFSVNWIGTPSSTVVIQVEGGSPLSAQAIGFEVAPVVLDLDRNGVHFDSPVQLVHSLFSADLVPASFVGSGDALLAYDFDRDGAITQSREVVFTHWSPDAQTDMQALLSAFDQNHDGSLSASDLSWHDFVAWTDLNADGLLHGSEIVPLHQLGIESVDLHYQSGSSPYQVADGDITVYGTSTVHWSDGSVGQAADTAFTLVAPATPSDVSPVSTSSFLSSLLDRALAEPHLLVDSVDGQTAYGSPLSSVHDDYSLSLNVGHVVDAFLAAEPITADHIADLELHPDLVSPSHMDSAPLMADHAPDPMDPQPGAYDHAHAVTDDVSALTLHDLHSFDISYVDSIYDHQPVVFDHVA